jgi:hypothetical protein
MQALPTDRHRAFVRAMYQVKPGHGAAVRAAKLAGFGTPSSTAQSMATIASRLTHDRRERSRTADGAASARCCESSLVSMKRSFVVCCVRNVCLVTE